MLRKALRFLYAAGKDACTFTRRSDKMRLQNLGPRNRPGFEMTMMNKIQNPQTHQQKQLNAYINDLRKLLVKLRNPQLLAKNKRHRGQVREELRRYWGMNNPQFFSLSRSVREAAYVCDIGLQDDQLFLSYAECSL